MTIGGHHVDDAMFKYIAQNIDADTYKLLLKAEPKLTFDKSFAILQIESRRKAKNKISELIATERFLFPKAISAEQCTHELVAKFHASLFAPNSHVLDMTMGLGVDDYYISQRVESLTAIEIDPIIAETGKHNFSILNANVRVVQGDSAQYLEQLMPEEQFDAIFIDPARRDDSGKRVYGLGDCMPNVLALLPLIDRHCTTLFIKASPMIDVTQSVRDLGDALSDVWAVSIKNECKELFFKLDFKSMPNSVMLHAINHDKSWIEFHTPLKTAQNTKLPAAITPEKYLYEPNASIMKLGCHEAVEDAFGMSAIAQNSHLMLSDEPVENYPGRCFRIIEIAPFKSKEIKQIGKRFKRINVATRNFRLSAEELKKRLKVEDGGTDYLFGTTLATGEQVLIIAEKVFENQTS